MEQVIKAGSVLKKQLQDWKNTWDSLPESRKEELRKHGEESNKAKIIDLNEKYNIPERYHAASLENFIAKSDEEKNAIAKIKLAWTENMFISGTVGTGKSYLAMCLKKEGATFYEFSEICDEVQQDYNKRRDMIDKLGNVKLLIIDEIGRRKKTEFSVDLLFDIMHIRWKKMKPTLLISNMTFKEFASEFGNGILDRFRPIEITLSGESKRG
ncbi:MAG: ATP-binding protein [Spirochaetaceae bacterium]|nr:ATP-binding protein [Spirochaetaceae bacterium]